MNADRHAVMERSCEYCGEAFLARVERVRNGQGRFCSLKHANLYAKEHPTQVLGYENGKCYWGGKYFIVRWYDENKNSRTTSYPKWWWTLNVGEVPEGFGISYKDGNPQNIEPSNFYMVERSEISRANGKMALGKPRPDIAKENNKWWRGGSSYDGYPTEFSKSLKKRIKIRDSYTCQCCYSSFTTLALDVHHIDRNTKNNDDSNLVTVCKGCHKGIHGRNSKVNGRILYFQSLLQ